MTLTEDEARTKWCPFARVQAMATQDGRASLTPSAFNRIAFSEKAEERDLSPTATLCIASECMAWRWATEQKLDEMLGMTVSVKSTTSGHCGLAGTP